jgi:transposase
MSDPKPTIPSQTLAQQRAQLIMQVRRGLVSATEAARQLGISRKNYYKWERRGLAAMVEALGDRKPGRPSLQHGPEKEYPHSLLAENNELRIRERQFLAFMLRFALGCIAPEHLNRRLGSKLPPKDLATLSSHLVGRSPCKRIRALIVVSHLCGVPADSMATGLGVLSRTADKYIRMFGRFGVDALFLPRKGAGRWKDPKYKDALFGILHSPPRDQGFNRTTWKVKDIACVMARIGMPIAKKRIGAIIRSAGYRFMKAREVLTSNDPDYREKVDRIRRILSTLKRRERFFSIDEFGPFAVKRHGGRRLVGPGEYPTIPQF